MNLELWHAWTCPYCMRVRIALAEKGVAYTEREIDLANKPPELFVLNPAGGVPVLVIDGTVVADSSRILEHLERRFPEPPLFPRDPVALQRARSLADRATALLAPHLPKLARGTPEDRARAVVAVREALQALEAETPEDGSLVGGFSVADIALATMVMKLPEISRPSALGLSRLARWEAAVRSRPSVAVQTALKR